MTEYKLMYLVYFNEKLSSPIYADKEEALQTANIAMLDGMSVRVKEVKCKGNWVEE